MSTATTTGVFNFSFTLPSSAYIGTYSIRIDANYSGNEIHDTVVFLVESEPVQGIPLYLLNDVGTTYNPGEIVYVSSTVTNSTGQLVRATVNITIYYPNGLKKSIVCANG